MNLNIKKISLTAVLSLCSLSVFPVRAHAEGAALGTDLWTRTFEQWGLFHPHANFCDSTEVFIVAGSSDQGFCIEKTERNSGAAVTWREAREACAADRKRLPEPMEFQFACLNSTGAGFTNNSTVWEWTTNFGLPMMYASNPTYALMAVISGKTSCDNSSVAWAAYSSGASANPYRCVR